MSDRQTSPEQEAAAAAFNSRRNADAQSWNNRVLENQGITPDTSPIATMEDGGPGIHPQAQAEISDSWRATEPTTEAETPSNVFNIAENPAYRYHENADTAVETSGEKLAAEALHPIEAAQKSSELIDALLDNPNAFQKNTIEIINFLSTPGLSTNNKEKLSSILLQELQNPNRPVDIDTINPYLAALATMKGEQSDIWQSTLRAEGERLINAKYDHIRKNRNNPTPATVSTSQESHSGTPLKSAAELAQDGTLTQRVQTEPSVAPVQPAEPVATSRPVNPEPVITNEAVTSNSSPTAAEAPAASTPIEKPAEGEAESAAENDEIRAQIETADHKNQELTNEIQGAWRNLPPTAQSSQALSYVPQRAGFLDLDGFKAQLEQRMQASHLRANEQFAGLEGNGLEKVLARKQQINREFEKLIHNIEKAKLNSSEVSKGIAEAAKIKEKYAENTEKMRSKLDKLTKKNPWVRDFIKFDPHVQRNAYYSKYGRNELGV